MTCAALLCYALLAHDRGDLVTAARVLGSAEAIVASIGYAIWSTDRVLHEDVKKRLTASLDDDRRDTEMDAGHKLRADEAIALAIHVAEACAVQQ